jgi:hypothetical protein
MIESESPAAMRQREQDADGLACPTCLAAVLGLEFSDESEKSAIRCLVRVDTGPSAAKAYFAAGACRPAIARLVADSVLSTLPDGALTINPPNVWAPSRLRTEGAEQLAAIEASAKGVLTQCTPSRDHKPVNRGQSEALRPSAIDNADGPTILKFDPGMPRRSSRDALGRLRDLRRARSS